MQNSTMTLSSVTWPAWPQFDEADVAAVAAVLRTEEWGGIGATAVREFEARWAEYLGVAHARSCSNGTVTLVMALQALGVGRGDEVIVPAYTFAATATAVLTAGAVPVFVDVELTTGNIDVSAVEAAITPRTRAVIGVHVAGLPFDIAAMTALCERHGVPFIEDAAHAHGSEWEGRKVGGFGALASFSFQTSKNMTAGEGGVLTTNDAALAEKVDSLRNCGRVVDGAWYEHQVLGGNHRLSAVQSALLTSALTRYPAQLARRAQNAEILTAALADVDHVQTQVVDPRVTAHAYHLYPFRYLGEGTRDGFIAALEERGVPATAGYPIPLQEQPVFRDYRFDRTAVGWVDGVSPRYEDVELANTARLCAETVWIPHQVLLAESDDIHALAEVIRTTHA
jgi:dTDP-4-amino-4,6-dideoxygalactose transaminase